MFLYDAFTDVRFGGNIAGVVPHAHGLTADLMQQIAREIAAPTTGFVHREGAAFALRFFTPTVEIAMCGHVVLGVTHALVDLGEVTLCHGVARFDFLTAAGRIPVVCHRDEAGRLSVMMTQNLPVYRPCPLSRGDIAEGLGIAVSDLSPRFGAEVVGTALRHLLIPVASADVLTRLKVDQSAIERWSAFCNVETVPVVALSPEPGIAARSRDLCAGIGTAEEAASGTTNAALACWMLREGLVAPDDDGIARLRNQQGVEMGRPSLIRCELEVGPDGLRRVSVGGDAVRSLAGEIWLDRGSLT